MMIKGGIYMDDYMDYVKLSVKVEVDTEKIEKDVETVKDILMKLSGILNQQLVFVANKDKVDVYFK